MPIHYRCPACHHLLSITTRKAGVEVPCPLCGALAVVPFPATLASDQSITPEAAGTEGDSEPAVDLQTNATADVTGMARSPKSVVNDEETLEHDEIAEDAKLAGETSPVVRHPRSDDWLSRERERAETIASDSAEPPAIEEDDEDEGGIQLRRASPNLGDLDLTSMVDVTFLLLIFFMVTASFSLQKTIELPKPNPDQKGAAQSLTLEDLQANTIFVKVDEANQIFVDDVPAGGATKLEDVLMQARLTTLRTEVAIDAHPEARHETVVQVIDAATGAGMQKVRIVSRGNVGE